MLYRAADAGCADVDALLLACQVEDLLREAMVLKEALDQAVSSSVLEKLLPKRYKQYQKGISQRS